MASYREVIKRSEFIGYAKAVFTEQEVHEFLQQVKSEHPKATHWVWAYKIGEIMFSSDAGEPSGSAGLPILNAIRSSGLDYVMVVVVRYFGGVLLGIKGLIYAYNSVARKTLELADKGGVVRQRYVTMELSYEVYGKLYEDLARLVSEPNIRFEEQVIMCGWVDMARKEELEHLMAQRGMSLQWGQDERTMVA